MTLKRGWSAWTAAWLAIVAGSLIAATTLAQLSAESSEDTLDQALGEHLLAEAGVVAEALRAPLDQSPALVDKPDDPTLRARLDALSQAGGLRALALFPTGGAALVGGTAEPWVVGPSERALVEAARRGAPQLGPLLRGQDAQLYRAVYVPLPGHPGLVLGVKGSGATLSAADRLEELQLAVGAVVVAIAALAGAALAAALTRPLRRLDEDLGRAQPGDPPESLPVSGPREVRRVARAARGLLAAIRERDAALQRAHAAQLRQLTTLSATVAHEVRNPLHALELTVSSLARDLDPDRRAAIAARATACVEEMEHIVTRFLDLSRPIEPRLEAASLRHVAERAAADAGLAAGVAVEGLEVSLMTDAELLGQVLRNLLRNAQEAGADQIAIEVLPDGLRVSDDGPGVSAVDVENLFTWFHTSRAQGTGLGLPQSRRICRALGGELDLERALPATFRVRLPTEAP